MSGRIGVHMLIGLIMLLLVAVAVFVPKIIGTFLTVVGVLFVIWIMLGAPSWKDCPRCGYRSCRC